MVYTNELKEFVTTFEQSKKLVEMGITHRTKFVWHLDKEHDNTSIRLRSKTNKFFDNEIYPAFLTDELIQICSEFEPWINVFGIKIRNKNDLIDFLIDLTKSAESGINTNNK